MSGVTSITQEISQSGSFVRQTNRFTTAFGDGSLPIEAGRYRLIWAPVCPWAHRSVIVRKLLGLEDVISLGTVDPIRPLGRGGDWSFTLDPGRVDPVLKIEYLSEAYQKADPAYSGRNTVPALIDLRTGKVVNNDYFHLTLHFETAWKLFHKADAPDLYPEALRPEIDRLNEIIFHEINNGVYKAGFARTQQAYDTNYDLVFNRLDWLEEHLSRQRYLLGNSITEADIRLYVTLARFDTAYNTAFQLNRNRLVEFPNLWAYTRDLYQTPGFGDTTDFDGIKKHYHLCCDPKNTNKILPKGPDLSAWSLPHDRARQFT